MKRPKHSRPTKADDLACERLVACGEELYMALINPLTPHMKEMHALLNGPANIGDLVLVRHARRAKARDRVGVLTKVETKGGYPYYWTIRTPRGHLIRWTNVNVVRLP